MLPKSVTEKWHRKVVTKRGLIRDVRWTMKLAPAALLAIGRRDNHRRLVRRRRVRIDCGSGLGAEIPNFGVKLQSCDAMGALLA